MMKSFWHDNLALLNLHHPELSALLAGHDQKSVGEIIETPSGVPTLRFHRPDGGDGPLAYNAYSPWQDTDGHMQTVVEGSRGLALFVGMGLGYGALRVLQERPTVGMMVIVEPCLDLFVMAMQAVDLRPLLLSQKVRFLLGDIDFAVFELVVGRIAALEDTHILRHVPSFQWREDLYEPLNQELFMLLNQINASGGTTRKAGERFFNNRLSNLTLLRNSKDLGVLKDVYQGKPAVLVAAGPSLDRSISDLKKIRDRCVLFAVDSAMAPLLKAGIVPDFVTSIDFQDLNFEKLAPFVGDQLDFSLISIHNVAPLIPKQLKPRHLFWTFHDDLPQRWIIKTLDIKELTPATFSVAHLSLGCALLMGCDPVIFVGQDLGYTTATGADHAAGTIIMQSGLPKEREIYYVPGLDGGQVATDRALLSLQRKFEDIIASYPDNTFLNATVAGVHIAGAIPAKLSELAGNVLEVPLAVSEKLEEAVGHGQAYPVDALGRECLEIVKLLQRTEKQLVEVIDIAKFARREIVKLQKKKVSIPAFSSLPPSLAKKLARFDQLNSTLDASDELNTQVVELTYSFLSENDRLRVDNEQVKEQGYLAWLAAEIQRIDFVNQERRKVFLHYWDRLKMLAKHFEQEETILRKINDHPAAQHYLALAELYCQSADYALAENALNKALASGASLADSYRMEGEIRAALLDFAGAKRVWQAAVVEVPGSEKYIGAIRNRFVQLWISVAGAHGMPGETGSNFPQLLTTWLGRLAALISDDAVLPEALKQLWEKHAIRLEELFAVGKIDQVELVVDAWKGIKQLPAVLVMQARCLAARGQLEEACGAMGKIVDQYPAEGKWLTIFARLLLESGRFEEGIARLQEAVALDPLSAGLWEELGDMLLAASDFQSAVIAFEKCFLALPNRVDVLRKMGDSYLADGQMAAAMAAYEAVLVRDPGNELARSRQNQAQTRSRSI